VLTDFTSYFVVLSNIPEIINRKFQTYKANLSFSAKVFIRLPSISDMAWDRYVAPFSYGLWLAVATAACALSVCLVLTTCGNERNQAFSLTATLFYIPACFCQQG
jgi:hypothetical protein